MHFPLDYASSISDAASFLLDEWNFIGVTARLSRGTANCTLAILLRNSNLPALSTRYKCSHVDFSCGFRMLSLKKVCLEFKN